MLKLDIEDSILTLETSEALLATVRDKIVSIVYDKKLQNIYIHQLAGPSFVVAVKELNDLEKILTFLLKFFKGSIKSLAGLEFEESDTPGAETIGQLEAKGSA